MTDSEATVQALRQCLDLIEAGETPEQALDRFPEQREALAPLVLTAVGLRSLEMPAAPPTVLAGLSEALDLSASTGVSGDGDASAADSILERLGIARWLGQPGERPLGPTLVRAVVVVLAAAFLLSTLALAAGRSTPGDLLYPLGRAMKGISVPWGEREPAGAVTSTESISAVEVESKPATPVARERLDRRSSAAAAAAIVAGTARARETASAADAAHGEETAAANSEATRQIVVVVVPPATAIPQATITAPAPEGAAPPGPSDGQRPTEPPHEPKPSDEPPRTDTPQTTAEASHPPTVETLQPTPSPTGLFPPVVISVLVADLDAAPLADALVQGWNDDTGVSAICTTNDGGACDLSFDDPGRFVVLAELPSPPVARWYNGKTSRDEADRIVLDTPGDLQAILVILPVGAVPLPTDSAAIVTAESSPGEPSATPTSPAAELRPLLTPEPRQP